MHFAKALILAASAAVASANSVTFWSLDKTTRTIYFTGNPGMAEIAPVTVKAGKKVKVEFPVAYIGNFYAVKNGADNIPGMLGEVNFNGWNDLTYYDVSAIVNPLDTDNVKQMWPTSGAETFSGCHNFPCNQAYYLPDDIQTKTTPEVDLMCTLGSGKTGIAALDV